MSIVYVPIPSFFRKEKRINCSFEGLCMFFLSLGSEMSMLEYVAIISWFYKRLDRFATSAWTVKEQ